MVSENGFAKNKQNLSEESMKCFKEKRLVENINQLSKTNIYNKK